MTLLPAMLTLAAAAALIFALFALYRSVVASCGGVEATALSSLAFSEERIALLEQKAALLASLRDLNLDRDLDKVSEADFRPIDTRLRREAKQVIQRLDDEGADYLVEADALIAKALKSTKSSASGSGASRANKTESGGSEANKRANRGRDKAARAGGHGVERAAKSGASGAAAAEIPAASAAPAADTEALDVHAGDVSASEDRAESAPEPVERAHKVCGSCQGDNELDARFCKHCGAKL